MTLFNYFVRKADLECGRAFCRHPSTLEVTLKFVTCPRSCTRNNANAKRKVQQFISCDGFAKMARGNLCQEPPKETAVCNVDADTRRKEYVIYYEIVASRRVTVT
jgi:hypothetical protein